MKNVKEIEKTQIQAMKSGDKDLLVACRAVLSYHQILMLAKNNKKTSEENLQESIKRQYKEYSEYAVNSPDKIKVVEIIASWMPPVVTEDEMIQVILSTKSDYESSLQQFLGLKQFFSDRWFDIKLLKERVDYVW